eukprot:COSAG02_NODE_26641_length_628_cov_1.075614_1_plen_130_part_00
MKIDLYREIQKANNALAERGSMRFAPMQADVEVNVFKPYSYAGVPGCPVKSLSKPVKTFKDNACKKFVEDLPYETEKQREAKARSRAFVDEMKKRKGAPTPRRPSKIALCEGWPQVPLRLQVQPFLRLH